MSRFWNGLSSVVSASLRQRAGRLRRERQRRLFRRSLMESLEARIVLNAAPVAVDDPFYFTAEDTALTVGASDTTLVDNDWDPEGDTITASVVDNPADGTLSNFDGTDGTFTYTPDTSFTGVDTFTYKLNDGTDDGNVVTVSIAVGGHLGPRTNLEETSRGGGLMTGDLELAEPLTPGVFLVYDSGTLPQPIIVVETFLEEGSTVPDEIAAQLTFDSSSGTDYTYDTTGLSAGDSLRFALQHDATSLSSGRYDYSVEVTTDISSTLTEHTYSGHYDVVNRGLSSHPFGRGWQLAGLDELVVETGGVLWVQSGGDALWFAEDGAGGFEPAEGDLSFSTLVDNGSTYTLTDKHGNEAHFNSSGQLTSREDRNGNTITYAYTSGLLTKITDPFNRDTTFTYTSGQLTSVSDFASRTATLSYDGSGRLTKITQPDPDGGGGPLAAPETEFSYDAASHQLATVTNALDDDTDFTYGSHDRLTKITHPDNKTWELTATQTIGLPTGSTGNSLTAAGPQGDITDERSKQSEFETDRFGHLTLWTDALNNDTASERNADGLLVRLTGADPDGGGGSQEPPVTVLGYDDTGNLVYQKDPRGYESTWTYTTSFNLVDTFTDALDNDTSYTYDTNGNMTKLTDAGLNEWLWEYDSGGRVTKFTTPDPDGAAPAGPLDAAVTEYSYDTKGRLTTLTNPDDTTVTFAYDTADNVTSVTDELSNVTELEYDTLNRLTSVTDREDAETTYEYDALGQMTKETDALGNETSYTFNSRGWVTKKTLPDPDGPGQGSLEALETTYTFDGTGNVTQIGEYYLNEGQSVYVGFSYDAVGRRTSKEVGTPPADIMSTEWTYDNLGRVTSVTDAADLVTEYEHDASGNVVSTLRYEEGCMCSGVETTHVYDALDRMTQSTDERGYATDFTYDSRGLLTRVDYPDPDGSGPMPRPFVYRSFDAVGRQVGEQNSWLLKTEYQYNSRDWLVKITEPDPDGPGGASNPVTTLDYDDAGRLVSVTDPLSRETAYQYDDEGRVTKITLPDPDSGGQLESPQISYAYTALGQVSSVTDELGGVTEYEFDNMQRLVEVTEEDPDDGGPLSSPVTSYLYGDNGLLESVTDPLGRETSFEYDDYGRRTKVTDDSGNETSYVYNDLNQVTKITQEDPDNGGPLSAPVTSYTFDTFQRLTQIKDPNNGTTSFTYDDAGNLLTLTDPVSNVTEYSYDGLGRVTMETNELDDSRSFYYDSAGRLTRRVDRNDRVRQFEYDDLDRVTAEKWFDDGTPVPSISIAVTTEGGPQNEVQRVGFSDDIELTGGTFTLTFDGQTTSSVAYDAGAATVESALEALSSIDSGEVSVVKSTDTTSTQEWELTFTGDLGATNVAQTTVDSSNVTGMMGITEIEATDTQGGGTNDEVQQVTLSNADGGTYRLAFSGETTAALDQDATAGEVETALEDLNGGDNVTVTGSAGGPWTITFVGTHSGEDQPKLNADAASATSGTEVREIAYTWDAAGQLTEADDPDSTYAYTYDDLGRVLTVDNDGTPGVPNVVLTSAYDAAGNRTSLSAEIDTTEDFLNTYSYDALHRLTRVDQEGQGGNTVHEKRVDFEYNAVGMFTEIARFNDTDGGTADEVATSTYTYDSLGRLTDLEYENGGTDLFTPYEWSYDNLHRVTQFIGADGTSDYTYDVTSQLTDADHDYQADESYSYDANGNRTMTGYTTGDNNQLTNDGTYSYEYDAEGNRTKRTHDTTDESTEYDWDHRNRLTEVTEKDDLGATTQVVQYTYDVFNRRIAKAVDTTSPFDMADAVIERYVLDDMTGVASLDGGNVVLDFVDADGEGSGTMDLERRYLYGDAVDQVLAQENIDEATGSADRVYWHLADHLGTIRDLAKNDGTLGEHYEYDSFGNVVSGDTSVTRYLFTGREFDEDTELQYSRARWYDAAVGRWVSEDPLGFGAKDANLSRYVGNAPTFYVDPSGEAGVTAIAAGAIVFVTGVFLTPTNANAPQYDGDTMMPLGNGLLRENTLHTVMALTFAWAAARGIAALGSAVAEEAFSQATGLPASPRDMAEMAEGGIRVLRRSGDDIAEGGMNRVRRADGVAEGGIGPSESHFHEAQTRVAKAKEEYGDDFVMMAKKKPKPGATGKDGATDVPSWAKGEIPDAGESGKDFAKKLLDQKYGDGKYDTGPGSEFSQIKKWADRHFEDP